MSEPRAIIRPDDKGKPDDIVIEDCTIHLERMRTDAWSLVVSRGEGTEHKGLWLWIEGRKSTVTVGVQEDELGCVDDTPSHQTTP